MAERDKDRDMIKNGILAGYLLGLSIYDGKERRIPVMLLLAGAIGAGFWMLRKGLQGNILQCVLGLIPGLLLLVLAWSTGKAGYGDGAVLAIVGAFEGYRAGVVIWGISLCAIAVFALVLLCLKRVKRDTQLPYIPFLCGGYIVWIMLAR